MPIPAGSGGSMFSSSMLTFKGAGSLEGRTPFYDDMQMQAAIIMAASGGGSSYPQPAPEGEDEEPYDTTSSWDEDWCTSTVVAGPSPTL
jgi:hypothetical protein